MIMRILALLFLAVSAMATPMQTNTISFAVPSPSPTKYSDFNMTWVGLSDQYIDMSFNGITVSATDQIYLRLALQRKGSVALEVSGWAIASSNRVIGIVPYTNIPPSGPYYAEVLVKSGTGSPQMVVGFGQIKTESSIFGLSETQKWASTVFISPAYPTNLVLLTANDPTARIWAAGASNLAHAIAPLASNALSRNGGSVTGSLDFASSGLDSLDYALFDAAPTGAISASRLQWNAARDTLRLGLNSTVNYDLGHQVILYARNADSNTINKGEVVYISGSSGDNATFMRASNDSETRSARTIGIMAETVAQNNFGNIVNQGTIYNLDTSAFPAGAGLYLGAGGTMQTNLPTAPLHGVFLGVVERSHANVGQIYVTIQNYQELKELSDVRLNGQTNLNVLTYIAASNRWEARSVSSMEADPVWGSVSNSIAMKIGLNSTNIVVSSNAAGSASIALSNYFESAMSTASGAVYGTINTSSNHLQSSITAVSNHFESASGVASNAVYASIAASSNHLQSSVVSVSNHFNSVIASSTQTIEFALNSISNKLASDIGSVSNMLPNLFQLSNEMSSAISGGTLASNHLQSSVVSVSNYFESAMSTASGAVYGAVNASSNHLQSSIISVSNHFRTAIGSSTSALYANILAASNHLQSSVVSVSNHFNSVIASSTQTIEFAINSLSNKLAVDISSVSNKLPNLAALSNSVSSIAGLQSSVIAVSNHFNSVLASSTQTIEFAINSLSNKLRGDIGAVSNALPNLSALSNSAASVAGLQSSIISVSNHFNSVIASSTQTIEFAINSLSNKLAGDIGAVSNRLPSLAALSNSAASVITVSNHFNSVLASSTQTIEFAINSLSNKLSGDIGAVSNMLPNLAAISNSLSSEIASSTAASNHLQSSVVAVSNYFQSAMATSSNKVNADILSVSNLALSASYSSTDLVARAWAQSGSNIAFSSYAFATQAHVWARAGSNLAYEVSVNLPTASNHLQSSVIAVSNHFHSAMATASNKVNADIQSVSNSLPELSSISNRLTQIATNNYFTSNATPSLAVLSNNVFNGYFNRLASTNLFVGYDPFRDIETSIGAYRFGSFSGGVATISSTNSAGAGQVGSLSANGSMVIEKDNPGALQRGLFGPSSNRIMRVAYGAEQAGAFGWVSSSSTQESGRIESFAIGATQRGWFEGFSIIGSNAYGAIQIGYNNDGYARNDGAGSIQSIGSMSTGISWITKASVGSILLGRGTNSTPYSVMAQGGFFGDGANVTNVNARQLGGALPSAYLTVSSFQSTVTNYARFLTSTLPPASPSASGVHGELRVDTTNLYIYIGAGGTNLWLRVPGSFTW